MGLIRLQNVRKQFGEQVVLDDVSLDLHTGQRVGLIGANGSGKTTIFRLITGLMAPDTGTVTVSKGLQVGYLPQEPEIAEGHTLHDAVMSVFAGVLGLEQRIQELSEQMARETSDPQLRELMTQYDRTTARFEAAGGYSYEQRLAEILGGLGFKPADYHLPMRALSGGQKCRAALARLLLQESQFLLLDEPTNHLDIDAVRWLEKFLAGHHGGAAIVSHDRYLLDRLADRIVEIQAGRLQSYPGNYSNFVQTKALRELTQQRKRARDQAFIEKERAFIISHSGRQRPTQSRGRQTRLERRLAAGEFSLEKTRQADPVHMTFDGNPGRGQEGKIALEVRDLAKRYGDQALFHGLSFAVPTGHRLGITGPNGTGKTTLLKIVLGQVPPDEGDFRFSPKASVGYFAQEATELDPEKTVVQEILAVRSDWLESHARGFAARFLFRGEEAFKRIGQLSGGEQSRVRLMKLILSSPNLLLLDEPTNHLDIPAREVLETALSEFAGTIVAVSHDRYFLDRICERLLVMRPDQHRLFDGNYSAYIQQVEREQAEAQTSAPAGTDTRGGRSRRPARPPRAGATSEKSPRSRLARLKLEELEAFIMDREARLAELHERFGNPELYQDGARVAQLRAEFDTLKSELDEAQAEWDTRAGEH